MKKILLSILVVCALTACDNKDKALQDSVKEAVAQSEAAAAATSDVASDDDVHVGTTLTQVPTSPEEAAKKVEKLKAECDYVPSGDIEKDAQDFVDMQLALAQKAADGKDTPAENDRVTAVMHILGEYYRNKGRQDEFQMLLGIKLQAGLEKLKAQ